MKDIKNQIQAKCREYFESQNEKLFTPGKTYIPAAQKSLAADDLEALVEASLDLWLTSGRFAAEFEEKFPRWLGKTPPGLLVNSGSSANLLAMSSLGAEVLFKQGLKPIEAQAEVITVAAAFPTTVNPILQNGWTPVFVDVEKETLNTTLALIENALSKKTRAVVLAHTLGVPFRADLIAEFCKKHSLYFIEDCCDALGAEVQGKRVGAFADFATASFYPAHHITMGEGGLVAANTPQLRKVAESLRDWGRDCWCPPGVSNTCDRRFCWTLGALPEGYDHKYIYSSIGYNLKVTDMQAAIGCSQLSKLPHFIKKRNENWKALNDGIKSSPVLAEHLSPVTPTPGTTPSWFGFPMHLKPGLSRKNVLTKLEENQVGTRLIMGGNLTKQPAYRNANFRIVGELKNTDHIMNHAFWIGVHPNIGPQELAYQLETLERVIQEELKAGKVKVGPAKGSDIGE